MSATKEQTKEVWEQVEDDPEGSCFTSRLRVISGWVVRVTQWNSESVASVSTCFVPDPQHEWTL